MLKYLKTIACVVTTVAATGAMGASVNSPHFGYVNNTSVSNTFDINSIWNGSDLITAATLSVSMSDNYDRRYSSTQTSRVVLGYTTRTEYYNSTCGGGFFRFSCQKSRVVTVPYYLTAKHYLYTDAYESLTLSAGDQSASDATNYYATRNNSGIFSTTTTTGYTGSLFAQIALNVTGLADLMADGLLESSLALTGNANLTNWSLSITTDPNQSINPSEVPLPASAFLLLGGLAGLGAMRRKRS